MCLWYLRCSSNTEHDKAICVCNAPLIVYLYFKFPNKVHVHNLSHHKLWGTPLRDNNVPPQRSTSVILTFWFFTTLSILISTCT